MPRDPQNPKFKKPGRGLDYKLMQWLEQQKDRMATTGDAALAREASQIFGFHFTDNMIKMRRAELELPEYKPSQSQGDLFQQALSDAITSLEKRVDCLTKALEMIGKEMPGEAGAEFRSLVKLAS